MSAGSGDLITKLGFRVVGLGVGKEIERLMNQLTVATLDNAKATVKINFVKNEHIKIITKQVGEYGKLVATSKLINGVWEQQTIVLYENHAAQVKATQALKARAIAEREAAKAKIEASAQLLRSRALAESRIGARKQNIVATKVDTQSTVELQRMSAYYKKLEVTAAKSFASQARASNKFATQQKFTNTELARMSTYYRQQEVASRKTTKATEDGTKASQNLMFAWQGIVQMMGSIVIYRAITRIGQGLIEATKQAAELSIKVAELQTISQNKPLIADEWFAGLQRLSGEFGTDIFDQAEAAYQALSNQVVEGAKTFDFLAQANKLAITTVATTTEAVNILTAALNAFDLKIEDTDAVAASFFKTVELGRVRLSEMATTFGRIAVPANQLGVHLNELQAAIDVATIKGIKFNQASTLIRNVLLKLIRPTKEMKKFFAEIGVESGEMAIKAFGLEGVLAKLEARTGGSSKELGDLFGRIRAITGAMIFAGDGVGKFRNALDELRESQADYDKASRLVLNSIGKEFDKAKAQIINFFLSQGRSIQQFVHEWTDGFRNIVIAVKIFTDILEAGASAAVVLLTAKLIALLLVAGPLTWTITGIIVAVGLLSVALRLSAAAAEAERAAFNKKWADREAVVTKAINAELKLVERAAAAETKAHAQRTAEINAAWNVIFNNIKAKYDENVKIATSALKKIEDTLKKQVKGVESAIKKSLKAIQTSRDELTDILKTLEGEIFTQSLIDKIPSDKFNAITQQLKEIGEQRKAALSSGDTDLAKELLDDYTKLTIEQINLDRKQSKEKEALAKKATEITKKGILTNDKIRREISKARRKRDFDRVQTLQTKLREGIAATEQKLNEIAKKQEGLTRTSLGKFAKNYEKILRQIQSIAISQQLEIEKQETARKLKAQALKKKLVKQLIDFEVEYRKFKEFDLQKAIAEAGGDQGALNKIGKDRQENIAALQSLAHEQIKNLKGVAKEQQKQELARLKNIKAQEQQIINAEIEKSKAADLVKQVEALNKLALERQQTAAKAIKDADATFKANQKFLDSQGEALRKMRTILTKQEDPASAVELARVNKLLQLIDHISTLNIGDDAVKLIKAQEDLAKTIGITIATLEKSSSIQYFYNMLNSLQETLNRLEALQSKAGGGVLLQTSEKLNKAREDLQKIATMQKKREEAAKAARKAELLKQAGLKKGASDLIDIRKKQEEIELKLLKIQQGQSKIIKDSAKVLGPFNDKLQKTLDKATGSIKLPQKPTTTIKKAQGGMIHGSDTVPALLSPGEMVINANSSRKFYSQLLGINNAGLSGFAQGGPVTNVGDINVSLQSSGHTETDIIAIGKGLQKEIRRGRISL